MNTLTLNDRGASAKMGWMIGGIVVAVVVIAVIVLIIVTAGPSYAQESVDDFAQCLTDEGVVMYGAYWCPHCRDTKRMFGDSFQYVTYVECDPACLPEDDGSIASFCDGYEGQPELCNELNIEGYDTWIFADGSRVVGEPSIETLAEGSGCPMPVEEE